MATPRKHWFRVADSVRDEPWSNDVAATFLRLSAHLNTRWARDGKRGSEAGSVVLPPAVLMALTGSGSLVRARRILDELAVHVSLTVHRQGANTVCEWPKFSIFQRYESEPGAEHETDAPLNLPSPQDAPARRKTQEDVGAETAPPPASPTTTVPQAAAEVEPERRTRRARGTGAPDDLTPEEKSALLAWVRAKEPDAEPEIRALVDACLDHFRASGALKADWLATCRTWIRNRKRYAPRGEPKTFGQLKADGQKRAIVGAVTLLRGGAA